MARDILGAVAMVVRFIMKMILNSVCWIQLTQNKIKGKFSLKMITAWNRKCPTSHMQLHAK